MTSNCVKERIGINVVSRIVEEDWMSGWQEYDAQNDDAVDGIILMRKGSKRPTDTGGVVFVQVKCGGNGYRRDQDQYPEHICILLGGEYITKHMPRWKILPGPAVIIFVDDTVGKRLHPAWWVDIKSNDCISPTNKGMVLIPKSQRFSHHTKGSFHSMCGHGPVDRLLKTIKLSKDEIVKINLGTKESLRNDAWEFYKNWRADPPACQHPEVGNIFVNRVGWKHITRLGRSPDRIVQSWLLLGAAKEMVRQGAQPVYLGHAKTDQMVSGATRVIDYIGLRSNIIFPHRHQSVIQVVLKRQRILNVEYGGREMVKIWFYSVFEPRRGMGVA